jgi:hypothetical protein
MMNWSKKVASWILISTVNNRDVFFKYYGTDGTLRAKVIL